MWGGPNDEAFYTGLFVGGRARKHAGSVVVAKKYYVQMDRDGASAVIVVRSQSF